tara:strand:- start:3139 stop:4257 length:1119 start_codon:yes stop_codon:yes gene_type:complete
MKRYVIIAGETSGDQYGGQLMNSMRNVGGPIEFWGVGGDDMVSSGLNQFEDIQKIEVIGFSEAIKKIPYMNSLVRKIARFVYEIKPHSVILIDFPGFNLSLAKKIKLLSPSTRIDFFISPQLWAWNENRVVAIKKHIDNMMVIFPFEEKFYKKHGVTAKYVGHPFLDHWKPSNKKMLRKKLNLHLRKKIIGIFPGSRTQELKKHFPIYLRAAKKLMQNKNIECVVGLAPGFSEKEIKKLYDLSDLKIVTESPIELLECCDAAIVTSGTISLQATFMNTPCIVAYKLSKLSGYISKLLIKVKYISMTNIVANKKIIPELIQNDVNTNNLLLIMNRLLDDREYYNAIKHEMKLVTNKFTNKSNVMNNVATIIIK